VKQSLFVGLITRNT